MSPTSYRPWWLCCIVVLSRFSPAFFKNRLQWLLLPMLLFWSQTVLAAVGFTITPSAVSNTNRGAVTLQITGLVSGASVVVQRFLDANTNGVIDGPDLLWQQFQLTDGQASVIGGVTNINVPGDTDP